MSTEETPILWLAGRLAARGACDVSRLAARIEGANFRTRIVCLDCSGPPPAHAFQVIPGLARRWGRASSARRFVSQGGFRPTLIHAFELSLAPAALELAERWRVPYV